VEMGLVVFITDWGYTHYVGQAKGVMYGILPDLRVIDIHSVPHFDIRASMHVLYRIHKDFPDNTMFLVVVDPGVGTGRKAIVGRFGRFMFVAPDNGVMTMVLKEYPDTEVVHFPKSCLHCEEPPCVPVCPTGASYKRKEDGIVLVDYDKCVGCRYCSWACPYGAREIDENQKVMKKCTLDI